MGSTTAPWPCGAYQKSASVGHCAFMAAAVAKATKSESPVAITCIAGPTGRFTNSRQCIWCDCWAGQRNALALGLQTFRTE